MKVLLTLVVFAFPATYLAAQTISFSTTCDSVVFCTDENNCGPIPVEITASATTSCNTGGLIISYTIDLDDDGSIDASGVGNLIVGNYPLGSHRVVFTAMDDCGGEETCAFLFLVEDCIAPVPVVDPMLIGEVGYQGYLLHAATVDMGSSDNCGISNMLIISPSLGPGQLMPPPQAASSWQFQACDLGSQSLDFWLSDEAGNWSYTSTFIINQDNSPPFVECYIALFEDIEKEFIGIKIGDVNKSAKPNDLQAIPAVEVRNTFNFELADQAFESDELVNVDFYAADIYQYAGFQFELAFDTDYLVFDYFEKGNLKYLDESNFGAQSDKGLIAASWVNMDFEQIEKTSGRLFNLQFTALRSGSLKDFISLSESRLSPEAYTHDLNMSNVNIHFTEAVPAVNFALENTPNPFRESTTIRFELPQSDQVTLKIIDSKGAVIKTVQQFFEKGSNEIALEGEVFPANGICFYQLATASKSATKKLLKID